MSAESPRHARSGGPLTVPSQPPSDRSLIDAVSGFINDVTLSASSTPDPKDTIQWARFETADINEPTPEGENDSEIAPLLLILGYGAGVQVWLIPANGEAQEVLSWRQGTVRVLRILPTPQYGDSFVAKRPLIALCDSASPGPTFCSLSFISVRGGEQVKSIKFKNPILDVQGNKNSVVVSFSERFAVFDARTLEDRMAVTTCYPCPCPLGGSSTINPIALGDRWLAYADRKINPSKRSSGGCEGEGVSSYTATVLHAAKSLSKGLRGLGESVAHSLAGGRAASQSPSPPNADLQQPGVITILDIEGNNEEDCQDSEEPYDPMVAHFVAHSEAIIALKLDSSGMLLVTADRRGHDFHVFRINPHPCGPALASVHHLYILHRGDTTAKVQDIAISSDSRWTAISSLRGTTHLFPISPYGGQCGVRTHTQPRVVNRLSRFHRSAGLPIHAGTVAPVGEGIVQGAWYPNPRVPPYPQPVTILPLAQLRPTAAIPTHTITRTSSGRQRLSSLSEEGGGAPLLARARFGTPPSAPSGPPSAPPATPSTRAPAHHALYLMAATGSLVHYILHPRPAANVPKEKVCDESPIELEVEAVSQWPLQRPPVTADLLAPLPPTNPLLQPLSCRRCAEVGVSEEERWLSQVEIVTHAGPHRRLWMGPQFVFKTYNCTGSSSSLSEAETVEVETSVPRSNPVNMPGSRPIVPVLIDSGSASSLEHSPSDSYRRKSAASDSRPPVCDVQLKEDLAEAMKEDQGWGGQRNPEERPRSVGAVVRAVDPLGTVVVPSASVPPDVSTDTDDYTHSNTDEATFRPVVRAPAAIPPRPDLVLRPLPVDTRIPVQSVPPHDDYSPDRPEPLTSDVVIPAELTVTVNRDLAKCEPITVAKEILSAREREREAEDTSASGVSEDCISLPRSSRAPPDDIQIGDASFRIKKSPAPKSVSEKVERDDVSFKDRKDIDKPIKENDPTAEVTLKLPSRNKQKNQKHDIEDVKPVIALGFDKETVKERSQKFKVSDKIDRAGSAQKYNLKDIEVEFASNIKPKEDYKETKCGDNQTEPVLIKNKKPDFDEIDTDILGHKDKDKKQTFENVETGEHFTCYKDSFKTRNQKPNLDDVESEVVNRHRDKEYVKEKKPRHKFEDVEKEIVVRRYSEKETQEKYPKHEVAVTIEKGEDEKQKYSLTDLGIELRDKNKSYKGEDIKTEDQAWDMLLNEPDKTVPMINVSQPTEKIIEEKPKSRRNRKSKSKSYDESTATKIEEDSFVEIHTIANEPPSVCNELVSISTEFEDSTSISSYSFKTKQTRQSKSHTPERQIEYFNMDTKSTEKPYDVFTQFTNEFCFDRPKIVHENISFGKEMSVEPKTDDRSNILKSNVPCIDVPSDVGFYVAKESSNKSRKAKSVSPFYESTSKKSVHKFSAEPELDKNVIVIDSTNDDFPEIQITRGKTRKKASSFEIKPKQVFDQPIKSWSSIAASKGGKKTTDEEACERADVNFEEVSFSVQNPSSSKQVSLQDKLIELCKRTDIMVAECDAPTELNFIEEHHSVMMDLPPLEPLDFALDDFKLEVMRDSLLDVKDTATTSPICKINIDDILSSIKETTSKAIETSTFNFVAVEKMSLSKEEGFSVVKNEKITSREMDIKTSARDEVKHKFKKEQETEKSSDDENTIASQTDSDKDDKRNIGAVTMQPTSKQSKAKKSRKKKK